MREPQIHSHITDALFNNYTLAWKVVICDNSRGTPLHSTNECITTWVEAGQGNYCFPCFVELRGRCE